MNASYVFNVGLISRSIISNLMQALNFYIPVFHDLKVILMIVERHYKSNNFHNM
jgi:hypothetical protein